MKNRRLNNDVHEKEKRKKFRKTTLKTEYRKKGNEKLKQKR